LHSSDHIEEGIIASPPPPILFPLIVVIIIFVIAIIISFITSYIEKVERTIPKLPCVSRICLARCKGSNGFFP
jgi:preprotein translocase subunit SecY